MEWHGKETAPKDGTEILVSHVANEDVGLTYSLAAWVEDQWVARTSGAPLFQYGEYREIDFTHWTPLPGYPG